MVALVREELFVVAGVADGGVPARQNEGKAHDRCVLQAMNLTISIIIKSAETRARYSLPLRKHIGSGPLTITCAGTCFNYTVSIS